MPSSSSSRIRETLRLLRRPVLFVWAAYLLLIPFYLVSGGLPQPGDALILLLVPMSLTGWDGRLQRDAVRILRPLVWFTLWVLLINVIWAVVLSTYFRSVLFSLYYIYNAAFLLSALILYQRFGEQFVRLTVNMVWITVVFQVLASFVMVGGASRGALFFHNPNQLGYYALLSACIIALTQRRLGIGLMRSSVGLILCGYLALLSTSRSAVAGILLLFMLMLLSNPRMILVGCLAAAALTLVESPVHESVDTFQQRLSEDRNPTRTFFEERGYDRIWNNKRHLLFGAGEGGSKRFAKSTVIGGAEIHSSAGTVVFSYGVVGTLLFLTFLRRVLRGASMRTALVLLPPLIYSLAHQGLRFTMLWVLLALFVALKDSPVLAVPTRRRAIGPRRSPDQVVAA